MSFQLVQQAAAYTVSTPLYEGPLDLLLQLIERAELDITRLALAQVTDDYLGHLREIQQRSADEVSAFIVIASRLLQIKAEALLPRPPQREPGEEDVGDALARQLLEYRKFKGAALWLAEREAQGLHTYLRVAPPIKVEARLDLSSLDLDELVAAAREVFGSAAGRAELNTMIAAPKVTVREQVRLIITALRERPRTSFSKLIGDFRHRLQVVVTFLAVLELIKLRRVTVAQSAVFSDIEIAPGEAWQSDADFELEFGE